MIIKNNFNIGATVYIKTDIEQHEHIITCILVTANGVKYLVKKGSADFYCYDFELSVTKNVLTTTTN